MWKALLIVLLVVTAACGAYRFPGPGGGSGTVSGQVTAYPCGGPVEPAARPCMPGPEMDCLPKTPSGSVCGPWPLPGMALVFTNGSATVSAKTGSDGFYSVQLPSGTWSVDVPGYVRIISGPRTVVVNAGAEITANYVVDTGIRAAA